MDCWCRLLIQTGLCKYLSLPCGFRLFKENQFQLAHLHCYSTFSVTKMVLPPGSLSGSSPAHVRCFSRPPSGLSSTVEIAYFLSWGRDQDSMWHRECIQEIMYYLNTYVYSELCTKFWEYRGQ
uniref:Uncharacterized protein n=1 Tax=Pipistrellus kuhlii TaxID=59472 RepID=A0A7J8B1M6_PIPKU|nr:hypothetical protein mPipKuh1_007753 [Pipistrellus kuhlii]